MRFFGYHSTVFKVFIYCVSAAMAGIAGMLFVLQDGMISPEMMGIIPSVEMVLWVAIGGRHSIFGAVLGALLTNGMKSYLSEYYPDIWLYFLGALFMIVVLYLPKGIVGLFEKLGTRLSFSKRKEAAHMKPILICRDVKVQFDGFWAPRGRISVCRNVIFTF